MTEAEHRYSQVNDGFERSWKHLVLCRHTTLQVFDVKMLHDVSLRATKQRFTAGSVSVAVPRLHKASSDRYCKHH